MSAELDALAAEASAGAPGASSPAEQPPEVVEISEDDFRGFAGEVIGGASNALCDRLSVTRLDQDEVGKVAGALTNLAKQYSMLGQLDPKAAAWLGLAAVTANVVSNRKKLVPPAAQPPQPKEVAA